MRELILLILIVASIPLVFKRPLWGIVIYLAFNIIRPEMLFWGSGGGAYVFKVYYGLIIAAAFLRGYLAKIEHVLQREFLLMIWLFVAVVVSTVFARFPAIMGNYYAYELLKAFIICALIYLIVSDFSDIRAVQNILLGCFAFLGVWGIEQQFRGNERLEGLGGNSWGDSNGVAALFVMFMPVAVAKVFNSKKRSEFWVAMAIVTVMVTLIVCTKSRGGLLGLVAGVAAYGFYSRNIKKIAFVAVIMAVVVMPFATQAYFERIKTMQSSETLDDSAKSRLVLWQTGLMIFADNPIFGTGFLSFPEVKMKYENKFLHLNEDFRHQVFREDNKKVTHNTYIQIMSECGLFGIVPFMILVTGGIFTGLRARRQLLYLPLKNEQLSWLCGLSAGITGFAVCMLTVDLSLVLFLYVQLTFVGILSRGIETADNVSIALQVQPSGEHA